MTANDGTVIDESWYVKPPGAPVHESAGGIVARIEGDPPRRGGRILIALGHQHGYASHVLPKGHIEPGESPEEAARREIAEEAGFTDLTYLDDLGVRERLDFRKRSWKVTHYYLYKTNQVDATPEDNDRHDPPAWYNIDDLPDLFWPEQRDLILTNREHIKHRVRNAGRDSHPPSEE